MKQSLLAGRPKTAKEPRVDPEEVKVAAQESAEEYGSAEDRSQDDVEVDE